MFDEIRNFIGGFAVVEIGVTAVLLVSGFGVPIPEDIPLLLGGFFCSETGGRLSSLYVMLPLTYVSVVGADLIVYSLGRHYGAHVIDLPLLHEIISPARLQKAQQSFHDHGGKALATARFLPGLRSAVFITAGIFRIPLWKMLVFDGGAALLSVPLWVLAGYFFGEHIPQILEYAKLVKEWLLGLVLAAIAAALLWFYLRRRRASSQA